jgi:hypothetical protein
MVVKGSSRNFITFKMAGFGLNAELVIRGATALLMRAIVPGSRH